MADPKKHSNWRVLFWIFLATLPVIIIVVLGFGTWHYRIAAKDAKADVAMYGEEIEYLEGQITTKDETIEGQNTTIESLKAEKAKLEAVEAPTLDADKARARLAEGDATAAAEYTAAEQFLVQATAIEARMTVSASKIEASLGLPAEANENPVQISAKKAELEVADNGAYRMVFESIEGLTPLNMDVGLGSIVAAFLSADNFGATWGQNFQGRLGFSVSNSQNVFNGSDNSYIGGTVLDKAMVAFLARVANSPAAVNLLGNAVGSMTLEELAAAGATEEEIESAVSTHWAASDRALELIAANPNLVLGTLAEDKRMHNDDDELESSEVNWFLRRFEDAYKANGNNIQAGVEQLYFYRSHIAEAAAKVNYEGLEGDNPIPAASAMVETSITEIEGVSAHKKASQMRGSGWGLLSDLQAAQDALASQ